MEMGGAGNRASSYFSQENGPRPGDTLLPRDSRDRVDFLGMDGSVGTDASVEPSTASAAEDARLLQAVARRDRKATAAMVLLYSDELFGYLVRRLSPNTGLAEDLL